MTGRTPIDMVGLRFGGLTVVARHSPIPATGNIRWVCLCDCGTQTTPFGSSLREGSSRSCGCLMPSLIGMANKKHGMRSTPTYSSWRSMHKRCTDPKRKWHHGLGIAVSDDWATFEQFFADMGVRPDGMTLDRKNGKLGYCKENCRWATNLEQHRNKSSNRFIEYGNESLTIAEWAERAEVSAAVIGYRLKKGWPTHQVLFQPLRKMDRRVGMQARGN